MNDSNLLTDRGDRADGAPTVEVPGASRSVYLSQPAAVADLIKRAARG